MNDFRVAGPDTNAMKKPHIKEIIVVEGRDDTCAVKRALDAETIETHGFGIKKETWDLIQNAYEKRGIIVFTDPDHAGEDIRRRLTEKFPDALEAFLSCDDARDGSDIGIENAEPEAIVEAISKARRSMQSKRSNRSMQSKRSSEEERDPHSAGRPYSEPGSEEERDPHSADRSNSGPESEEERDPHSAGRPNSGPGSEKDHAAADTSGSETDSSSPVFTQQHMIEYGLSGLSGAEARRRALGKELGIGYGNTGAFLRKLNRYGITMEEFEAACRKLF